MKCAEKGIDRGKAEALHPAKLRERSGRAGR